MIVRADLARHPADVAPALLGAVLACTREDGQVAVRLTEVEAYAGVGEDPGSHAHRRRTPRNTTMFGEVGHLYVYFTYGMHWCLNIVTHTDGLAGAVLLRAGAVIRGEPIARSRRPAATRDRDLARGPARLAAALGVDGSLDGVDLLDLASPVRLLPPEDAPTDASPVIRTGPRTGVAGPGAPTPWRFWFDGEPTVSPHRPAQPRGTPKRPAVADPRRPTG